MDTVTVPSRSSAFPGTTGAQHGTAAVDIKESVAKDLQEHHVFWGNAVWNTSTPTITAPHRIAFPYSLLFNNGGTSVVTNAPATVLSMLAYFRMGFKVRMKLVGTPFHQGLLCVWYRPYYAPINNNNGPALKLQITSFPHVYINASEETEVEFDIPFNYPWPMLKTSRDSNTDCLGNLYISSIDQLVVPTGAPPALNLNIWITPLDVNMSCYKTIGLPNTIAPYPFSLTRSSFNQGEEHKNVYDRMEEILENFDDYSNLEEQSKVPKVSKMSVQNTNKVRVKNRPGPSAVPSVPRNPEAFGVQAALEGAMKTYVNPIINSVENAVSAVGGAIDSVANLFDNPDMVEDVKPICIKSTSSYAHVNRGSISSSLALTAGLQRLPRSDEITSIATLKDHLSFEALSYYISFATTDTPGAHIYSFDNHPTFMCHIFSATYPAPLTVPGAGPGTVMYHTPLSYFCMPYLRWRGSLKWRFQFVCTNYHALTVAFVYRPSDVSSQGSYIPGVYKDHAQCCWTELVEIKGSTTVDIEIPYASQAVGGIPIQKNILMAFPDGSGTTLKSFPDLMNPTCNGVLACYVVSPLTCPSGLATTINCQVALTAGDDFELAGIDVRHFGSIINIGNDYVSPDYVSNVITVKKQDEICYEEFEDIDLEEQSDAPPDGNAELPTEPTPQVIDAALPIAQAEKKIGVLEKFYGESVMNMYNLLKRYQTLMHMTIPLSINQASVYRIYLPVSPQLPSWVPVFDPSNGQPKTDYYLNVPNFMEYFSYPHTFWRGSMRYRVLLHNCITPATIRASFYQKSSVSDTVCWFGNDNYVSTDILDFRTPATIATGMLGSTRQQYAHQILSSMMGMDIQQQQTGNTLDVTVPWCMNTDKLPLYPTRGPNSNVVGPPAVTGTPQVFYDSMMGNLIIDITTSWTTANNNATSMPPMVEILSCVGDDFVFEGPRAPPKVMCCQTNLNQ
jgi:hypothetical protein